MNLFKGAAEEICFHFITKEGFFVNVLLCIFVYIDHDSFYKSNKGKNTQGGE